MEDYRKTFSWNKAVELSLQTYALSDELPSTEEQALGIDLKRAAVDIPAGVAIDLVAQQPARLDPLLRLQAAVEIIRRVYPALDTAKVDDLADRLFERLSSSVAFAELIPPPEPPDVPPAEAPVETEAEAENGPIAEPDQTDSPDQ